MDSNFEQITRQDIVNLKDIDGIVKIFKKRGFTEYNKLDNPYNGVVFSIMEDKEIYFEIHIISNEKRKSLETRLNPKVRHLLIISNDYRRFTFITNRSVENYGFKTQKKVRYTFYKDKVIEKANTTLLKMNSLVFGDLNSFDALYDFKEVVKEFYNDYVIIRSELIESIQNINDKLLTVKYAQIILDRIIFLYFIQKKGLLNGDEFYLQNYYKIIASKNEKNNYYRDFLKDFFFNALSESNHIEKESLYGIIPFLNGGLFVKNLIEEKYPKIIIPNEIFDKLLTFFERYRWYIDERDDFGEENSVSPEILGYIFEKTINMSSSSGKGQKLKGAYYTPERITAYMSEKTIFSSLLERINKKFDKKFENVSDIFTYEYSERKQVALFLFVDVLPFFSILDNACGSGAFLLAILSTLREIYTNVIFYILDRDELKIGINEYLKYKKRPKDWFQWEFESIEEFEENNHWQYFIKRYIIIHNIYGVDIEEGAIEITKLRLWLYMVSNIGKNIKNLDKESTHSILDVEPLPNINYNIRCGNSLIGFSKIKSSGLLEYISMSDELIKQITKISSYYPDVTHNLLELSKSYNITNILKIKSILVEIFQNIESSDKTHLIDIIDSISDILNNELNVLYIKTILKSKSYDLTNLKAFYWFIEFPKVMETGGFDIIIGNPPYITLALGKKQKIFSENELECFRTIYPDSTQYKGNTYALFIERSIDLIKENGQFSFIIPNTLLLNTTSDRIRKKILDNFDIKLLINITDKVFEDAEIGGNLIFFFQKAQHENNIISIIEITDINMLTNGLYKLKTIKQKEFEKEEGYKFYTDIETLDLKRKLNKDTIRLGKIVSFYQGVITGDNNKFVSNKKVDNRYKRLLRGKDINRYSLNFNNTYLLFDKDELWSNTNEEFFLAKEKLINRQTGDKLVATYDSEQYFSLDSTHVQILKDPSFSLKYILALFNSTLLNFYYQKSVQEEDRTFAQVKIVNLKTLPIKKIKLDEQTRYIELVDKILELNTKLKDEHLSNEQKGNILSKIEYIYREIDELVFKLYGISDIDKQIILSNKK